jgi:hypothetical protein
MTLQNLHLVNFKFENEKKFTRCTILFRDFEKFNLDNLGSLV